MTVTPANPIRKSREITVSYLGELLHGAGFIDEKQRTEVDNVDRQLRLQSKGSKGRSEDEPSPFKALAAMNLTDASGTGTRIDDYLVARLIAEDLLDELFLTVSPALFGRYAGDAKKALVDGLDLGRKPLGLSSVRRHGSHLFLRYTLD